MSACVSELDAECLNRHFSCFKNQELMEIRSSRLSLGSTKSHRRWFVGWPLLIRKAPCWWRCPERLEERGCCGAILEWGCWKEKQYWKFMEILWTARGRWRPTFQNNTKKRCQSPLKIKLPLQLGKVHNKNRTFPFCNPWNTRSLNILTAEWIWLQKMFYFVRCWMEWSRPMLVWNWRLSWMCQQAGHLEKWWNITVHVSYWISFQRSMASFGFSHHESL